MAIQKNISDVIEKWCCDSCEKEEIASLLAKIEENLTETQINNLCQVLEKACLAAFQQAAFGDCEQ